MHVLIKGLDFDSDTLATMEKFKLLATKMLYRRGLPKMQEGFYDHIVRAGDDWRGQARYIALNPVRAGLVEHFFDYPYLGSLHGEVRDLFL